MENADIIIYAGSLVNPELLEYAKDSAEIYNSAKMNLDEVIDVMKQGDTKNIVRLHTGDPCVYGAIREQMDRLDKLGIEYDVCPRCKLVLRCGRRHLKGRNIRYLMYRKPS